MIYIGEDTWVNPEDISFIRIEDKYTYTDDHYFVVVIHLSSNGGLEYDPDDASIEELQDHGKVLDMAVRLVAEINSIKNKK